MGKNMGKSYSIAEARDNLAAIVHDVEETAAVELTRRGKPVAVLLSVDEYRRLAANKRDLWDAYTEFRRRVWYEETVERYERQKAGPQPTFGIEVHVLRIGDAVVCTNPFELFTEYGIQMKARSKAVQTFVVQLAGWGEYLPTEEAVRGGHYSAIVHSNQVGPEGGRILVDRTVAMIESLWAEE